MTARWVDDEPIPYMLTATAWTALTGMMTAREAAAKLSLSQAQVSRLAMRGELAGRKVEAGWLLDVQSVADYPRRRREHLAQLAARPRLRERLPAGPLLSAIDARDRGGRVRMEAKDAAAVRRARREGWVTPAMADRLVVRVLGVSVWDVWDL